MIILRLSAFVAAAVTVILNAVHGYKASPTLEFAVMFAALNAALDIAKCSLIPAATLCWQSRAPISALLFLLLFPFLFANSITNAVSQVLATRDAGKAVAVADNQTRQRAEAAHTRLTTELAAMQANDTFKASAACALPKSTAGRTFCETFSRTKADLDDAETTLRATTATDPHPLVTWLAATTGKTVGTVSFALALMPVLLAELVGSLGFVRLRKPVSTARSEPKERRRWLPSPPWPRTVRTAPAAIPGPPPAVPVAVPPIPPAVPTLTWPVASPSKSP